jgi:hypothetical protein
MSVPTTSGGESAALTTRVVPPRQLNSWERGVLCVLLSRPFPGSHELRLQLPAVRVSEEYVGRDPSVVLTLDRTAGPTAPVRRRIPVEAEGRDEDGRTIHVLLHVLDGYLWELELYRSDGGQIRSLPEPESLTPFSIDCLENQDDSRSGPPSE